MSAIRKLIAASLPLLLLVHLFVQEIRPDRSSYSFRFNILDCNNIEPLKGCRHEIGHKMDDDLGYISNTPAFNLALANYVAYEMREGHMPSDVAMLIHLYPDRSPIELYAAIYSRVDGDISKLPASLQPFYSTNPAYLELYNCLAHEQQINICNGTNFSYLRAS